MPERGTELNTVRMFGDRPFPPRVSEFTRRFWDALASRQFLSTRCRACGRTSFPPKPLCRGCWGEDIEWVSLGCGGRLYSFTRVHIVPGRFRSEAPYAIGLVDLDSGIRLMCRLVGEIAPATIGQAVELVVLDYDDGPLFGARPRQGTS